MPVNIVGSEAGAKAMLLKQLNSLFFISKIEEAAIDGEFGRALARCQRSFSKTRNKYYSEASATKFDPLQGCQWSRFLYELARCIFVEEGVSSVCDKLYALNKAMSSVDLYYQVAMPDIFMFDHPFGSVMGRASYSDYFTFSQGCTVGNNRGIYPRFGQSVFMFSNSKVIGDCEIGDNVIIGANAYMKDTDIPGGSLVFGQSPDLVIKENKLDYVRKYAEQVFSYE